MEVSDANIGWFVCNLIGVLNRQVSLFGES